MAGVLFKWLIPVLLAVHSLPAVHPIYVSVTQIDYNKKEKTLEISCKMFTEDLEKVIRDENKKLKIDLLDPAVHRPMDSLIRNYVLKHLSIFADGKQIPLRGLGFEQKEEGIMYYLQADNINSFNKIIVTDNILYESQKEQMNIIHVSVNGNRQSTKLVNPESKAEFVF